MSFRTLKLELMSFIPELNAVQAGIRLNNSYQHLLDIHPWSFLFQEYLIYTVAPYTTGTVDVTSASTAVTGTSTVWTTAMQNRFLKVDSDHTFYKITTVGGNTSITLAQAYGTTSATDQGYSIFQHQYAIPTDCKHIVTMRRSTIMSERTKTYIDTMDPDRCSTGEPLYWTMLDDDYIEIWPVPDAAYAIRMYYRKTVNNMSAEADTPEIKSRVILAHARMASYLQLASNPERGRHFANLYQLAKAEFEELFFTAIEEDMRHLSLPTTVRNVSDFGFPMDNDFVMRHDVGDPRWP